MYKDIWNRSIWKKEEERPARIEDYSGDIEELGLSVRSFNCLKRAGCHKISDVLKILEDDEEGLRKIRNLGARSETEIRESLAHYQEICGSPTQSPAGSNAGTKYKLIVPAKKVWDTEKHMYFLVYFEYLDANGFFDRMPEAVAEVESTMKPNMADSKIVLGVCMDLVYYYSYHNIVPGKAKEYYHRIVDDISKDTDPNAMFVKGFYELNCFGNVEVAKNCAIKALEKIDDFSTGDEREYCRKCIARLNHAIDNFPKQA